MADIAKKEEFSTIIKRFETQENKGIFGKSRKGNKTEKFVKKTQSAGLIENERESAFLSK